MKGPADAAGTPMRTGGAGLSASGISNMIQGEKQVLFR